MRILLDECVPRPFKYSLTGEDRECLTVSEAGFAGTKNGALLKLAETRFDVFLTVDQGFEYQQNLSGRKIAVIIIRSRSNRFADVKSMRNHVFKPLDRFSLGNLSELDK